MRKAIVILILAIGCCLETVAQGKTSFNMKRANESFEVGNYLDALNYTESELANNPQSYEALMLQCRIYMKHDIYDMALTTIDKALKYAPKKANSQRAEMLDYRSQTYAAIGDTAKALTDIKAAIALDAAVPDHLYSHINLVRDLNDLDAEAADIRVLESRFPDNAIANVYVGRYYTDAGKYEEALKHLTYATKLLPNVSTPFCYRASSYMKQHKWNDAAKDIVTALKNNSNNYAESLLATMTDSAFIPMVTTLKAQSKAQPDDCQWPYYIANCYVAARKYDDAINYYKEVIEKSTEGSTIREFSMREAAQSFYFKGDFHQAFNYINQAIACDTTYQPYLYDRSEFYISIEHYEEAIADINRLIELDPEHTEYYHQKGYALYLAERYDEAIETFNVALALNPYHKVNLLYRGRSYRRLGREDEARADFERCLAVAPDEAQDRTERRHDIVALALLGRTGEATALYDSIYASNANGNNATAASNAKDADAYVKVRPLALLGRTEEALDQYEKGLTYMLNMINFMNDPDFDAVRQSERYSAIIERFMPLVRLPGADDEAAATDTLGTTAELITTEVPFTKEAGIYKVRCSINGLPLDFYFDTGAADVTLSDVEANFMLKNGYLTKSDIKGKAYYGDANGDLNEGTIINLRKVEFGGLTLENVKASIVHNQQAPLLLGQTVLSRLGKIEIDYSENKLKITHNK